MKPMMMMMQMYFEWDTHVTVLFKEYYYNFFTFNHHFLSSNSMLDGNVILKHNTPQQ